MITKCAQAKRTKLSGQVKRCAFLKQKEMMTRRKEDKEPD